MVAAVDAHFQRTALPPAIEHAWFFFLESKAKPIQQVVGDKRREQQLAFDDQTQP